MHPAILIFLVFAGCCTNVITLEFLIQAHPGSGNIVTFAQFLFIAVEGFIFEFKFGSKKSVVPMKNYILMVSMFFVTSAINNYSLNFNISMPLHMIFKSGSLIANMTLGIFILKRSYKPSKYVAVVVVTIGIVICSLMSATEKQTHNSMEESPEIGRWLIGISMLTFALFASARLGIFQEQIYAQYGKHPKEALFYNHALPLPAFALLSHHIYDHAVLFSASEPVLLPVIGWSIPKLWLILLFNVITQYICIRAVFVLTSECQSLTVTLVITLRKFLSLLFSVFYFQNPFTPYHWFGTFLVFGGTLLFLDIFSLFQQSKPKELKTQ